MLVFEIEAETATDMGMKIVSVSGILSSHF